MKISVITAVFNREQTVGESISSLQNQTYSEFEHVIQDGGSTDGTLEIIRRTSDPRIQVVSGRDGGIYDAINRGIARATGDVVGLLHSDDVYGSQTVLETIAETLEDQTIDGVYGDLQYVSASNPSRVVRHWESGPFRPELLRRGWMPPHPTLYLKRQVFARLGAYDTSYRIAADYEAMLRWLNSGQVRLAYIPQVFVRMRVGGESNRSIGKILKKSAEDYRAVRRHKIGGVSVVFWKNISKLPQFRTSGALKRLERDS